MKDRIILTVAALVVCSIGGYMIGQNYASHQECTQALVAEKLETKRYREEAEALNNKIKELQNDIAYRELVDEMSEELDAILYNSLPLDEELQQYTYEQCVDNNCDDYYEMVLAIMWQESNFNAAAVSPTDDYGLMQINKVNHKWLSAELGITDFLDAKQNIKAGVHLLSKLVGKYKDPHAVLMAYNLGEGGAAAKWRQGIYNTSYSLSVMRKTDMVKENSYI